MTDRDNDRQNLERDSERATDSERETGTARLTDTQRKGEREREKAKESSHWPFLQAIVNRQMPLH